MNKTQIKLLSFFDEYVETNINGGLRKIMMKNSAAILPTKKNNGIAFTTDKVSSEDYEIIKQYQKEVEQIKYIKVRIKNEGMGFFSEFKLLSKYMILANLNSKECLEIISQIISFNILEIETFKNEFPELDVTNYLIISFDKISELSEEERKKMIEYQEYSGLCRSILSKEERKKQEYILSKSKSLALPNPNKVVKQAEIFKTSFLDKQDSFEEYDINNIVESLLILGVDESIINGIKTILIKDLDKRKRNSFILDAKPVIKPQVIKKTNILTDKEYKAIKKELRTYFDFYNVEKVRELNSDEIIQCIELLVKIDSPIEEIKRFIGMFEKKQNEYNKDVLTELDGKNIISVYSELYNKLKYYEKKLNIEDNLSYINDCLQEMFMCSWEDYRFYKNEIENELRRILILIPQTYEYEIKEIEKRIKYEI